MGFEKARQICFGGRHLRKSRAPAFVRVAAGFIRDQTPKRAAVEDVVADRKLGELPWTVLWRANFAWNRQGN